MRLAPASQLEPAPELSTEGPRALGEPGRRHHVRPLDDGTTEQVQVIAFVLQAGDSVQPVLWLERRLLE